MQTLPPLPLSLLTTRTTLALALFLCRPLALLAGWLLCAKDSFLVELYDCPSLLPSPSSPALTHFLPCAPSLGLLPLLVSLFLSLLPPPLPQLVLSSCLAAQVHHRPPPHQRTLESAAAGGTIAERPRRKSGVQQH